MTVSLDYSAMLFKMFLHLLVISSFVVALKTLMTKPLNELLKLSRYLVQYKRILEMMRDELIVFHGNLARNRAFDEECKSAIASFVLPRSDWRSNEEVFDSYFNLKLLNSFFRHNDLPGKEDLGNRLKQLFRYREDESITTDIASIESTLPLSAWPFVLERAWKLEYERGIKGPDAIFYHLKRSLAVLRTKVVPRNNNEKPLRKSPMFPMFRKRKRWKYCDFETSVSQRIIYVSLPDNVSHSVIIETIFEYQKEVMQITTELTAWKDVVPASWHCSRRTCLVSGALVVLSFALVFLISFKLGSAVTAAMLERLDYFVHDYVSF